MWEIFVLGQTVADPFASITFDTETMVTIAASLIGASATYIAINAGSKMGPRIVRALMNTFR